jgi:hypothetical protein
MVKMYSMKLNVLIKTKVNNIWSRCMQGGGEEKWGLEF